MANNSNNPNLKHNKALHEKRLIQGVPSTLFVLAIIFVVICFVAFGFLISVVAGLLIIPPLIFIHKDDDQALTILLDKLKRPNLYSAGGANDKCLKIIKKRNNKLHVLTINEVQN